MSPIVKLVVAWIAKYAWKKTLKPLVIQFLKWLVRNI